MHDNSFHEEIFPTIQHKLTLVQLEAIYSSPATCYLGEDTNLPSSTLLSVICRGVISGQTFAGPVGPPLYPARAAELGEDSSIRQILAAAVPAPCLRSACPAPWPHTTVPAAPPSPFPATDHLKPCQMPHLTLWIVWHGSATSPSLLLSHSHSQYP